MVLSSLFIISAAAHALTGADSDNGDVIEHFDAQTEAAVLHALGEHDSHLCGNTEEVALVILFPDLKTENITGVPPPEFPMNIRPGHEAGELAKSEQSGISEEGVAKEDAKFEAQTISHQDDSYFLLVQAPGGKLTSPHEVIKTCSDGTCPGHGVGAESQHLELQGGLCKQTIETGVKHLVDVHVLHPNGYLSNDTQLVITEAKIEYLKRTAEVVESLEEGDEPHKFVPLVMNLADIVGENFTGEMVQESSFTRTTRKHACDHEINELWEVIAKLGYCREEEIIKSAQSAGWGDHQLKSLQLQIKDDEANKQRAAADFPADFLTKNMPVTTKLAEDKPADVHVTVTVNLDDSGSFTQIAQQMPENATDRARSVTRKSPDGGSPGPEELLFSTETSSAEKSVSLGRESASIKETSPKISNE